MNNEYERILLNLPNVANSIKVKLKLKPDLIKVIFLEKKKNCLELKIVLRNVLVLKKGSKWVLDIDQNGFQWHSSC
jgi:hypothetical protein